MKNKSLLSRMQYAIWTDSGETYIDTGVKMLLAIVIGALLLTGIYGIFKDIVLTNVSGTIQGFFDKTPALGGSGGGGNSSSGGQGDSGGTEPAGFPISWNSMEVVDNVSAYGAYEEEGASPLLVKVSDYVPAQEELENTKISRSDGTIFNFGLFDPSSSNEACGAAYSSQDNLNFVVYSVSVAGKHSAIEFPEAGFYVYNVGYYENQDFDFVIDLIDDDSGEAGDGEQQELITFTVDGTEFQAEKGMNWIQWCDSEFDIYSAFDYDEEADWISVLPFTRATPITIVYNSDDTVARGKDAIINNGVYYSASCFIDFTINDVMYSAFVGMTWGEWVESDFNYKGDFQAYYNPDNDKTYIIAAKVENTIAKVEYREVIDEKPHDVYVSSSDVIDPDIEYTYSDK